MRAIDRIGTILGFHDSHLNRLERPQDRQWIALSNLLVMLSFTLMSASVGLMAWMYASPGWWRPLLAAGVAALFFRYSVWEAFAKKRIAGDNPWGPGATTLEWTLSSPPPFHQFNTLPVIK
jgi:heme/copper-type cytochrome/quinol oxidase subunit 1